MVRLIKIDSHFSCYFKSHTRAQNVINSLLLAAHDVVVYLMGSDWLASLQYCIVKGIDTITRRLIL
ncbi:hypothetical protein [Candidatus Pristimantibacillus sp. PTI5]|uniref:hypothetical protein n=1 Tax=Candidatus Pristimantibacillus sp. PTI5 TaxID=3400422 RepID=UPI003B022EAE